MPEIEAREIRDGKGNRILERDGTRIGFSINGGDPSQDGAAVLVSNIQGIKDELEQKGANIGNWRVDEQGGQSIKYFSSSRRTGCATTFTNPLRVQRDAQQPVAADGDG